MKLIEKRVDEFGCEIQTPVSCCNFVLRKRPFPAVICDNCSRFFHLLRSPIATFCRICTRNCQIRSNEDFIYFWTTRYSRYYFLRLDLSSQKHPVYRYYSCWLLVGLPIQLFFLSVLSVMWITIRYNPYLGSALGSIRI